MMRSALFGLALATAIPATGVASAAEDSAPREVVKDIVYRTVDGRALHLDIYSRPGTAPTSGPVLLHFHGGGWARGARPEGWAGFRPFLAAGFSVIAVEYRLAGEASAPAAVEDARCALHWVGVHAARMGFDPQRVVMAGTSAGAHLALMAGLLPGTNDIDPPECAGAPRAAAILDFYGPTDLTALRPGSAALHPTVANWIGPRTDAPKQARRLSPVAWLSANSPPIFIVHGDADPVVPLAQSQDLKRRLDALAVPSALYVVKGGGHGKFEPASQSALTQAMVAFLCALRLPTETSCKN